MKMIGGWTGALAALAFTGAFVGSAHATPFAGTFDIDGTLTVDSSSVNWTSDTGLADEATILSSDATGSFAALANTNVTIDELIFSTEPVGTTFSPQNFLSFLAAPSSPQLLVNLIAAGIYSSSGCTAPTPAAGQLCTPSGTPFDFQNISSTSSSLTFDLSGVTSNGLSTWSAIFTSQFNAPFQTVLADEAASGSFSNSYSAQFLVTANATTGVPEPFTIALFGSGLVAMGAMRRRKLK